MIIVRLMGGMGNQMFQYAFAKSLSIRENAALKIDLSLLGIQPTKFENAVVRHFAICNFHFAIFNALSRAEPALTLRKPTTKVRPLWGRSQVAKATDCKSVIVGSTPTGPFRSSETRIAFFPAGK